MGLGWEYSRSKVYDMNNVTNLPPVLSFWDKVLPSLWSPMGHCLILPDSFVILYTKDIMTPSIQISNITFFYKRHLDPVDANTLIFYKLYSIKFIQSSTSLSVSESVSDMGRLWSDLGPIKISKHRLEICCWNKTPRTKSLQTRPKISNSPSWFLIRDFVIVNWRRFFL